MDQISGKPYWQVHADKDGGLDPVGTGLPAAVAAAGISDLFVFSHGWGSSEGAAADLYQAMFAKIAAQVDAGASAALPSVGFAGIYWPSLWFPDPNAAEAVAGPAALAANLPSTAVPATVTGGDIAQALQPAYAGDATRSQAVTRLGELLDTGEQLTAAAAPDDQQEQALKDFHGLLAEIVTAHPHAAEDAGEWATITAADPAKAYTFLADTMGTAAGAGDAQGIGDKFKKVWSGAKDALRVASYYEMKCRAGDIGRAGIGPMLERLHAAAPGVRVHLIGHSFGARLVSFSLSGISSPQASPVASLSLVQGAFSHWSFAPNQPYGDPGALAGAANRVHGPLVSTFSNFDWAVGRWYPKASLLTHQDNQSAEALADLLTNRWGGLGADGFRGVSPIAPTPIKAAGADYRLQPGGFYPIDSHTIIDDVSESAFAGAHSDIRHDEVAWLIVSAASSTSLPAPVAH
jgi:hypothetical protein